MTTVSIAFQYESAKERAEEILCRLWNDRGNRRLLFRYVRALRACERLRGELKGGMA